MKAIISCLLLFTCISCSKNPLSVTQEVKYEIQLTNTPGWHGSYMDKDAVVRSVNNGASNWTYSFKNTNGLKVAVLNAYPTQYINANSDVKMTIYVNGSKVAEEWASNYPQVMYNL